MNNKKEAFLVELKKMIRPLVEEAIRDTLKDTDILKDFLLKEGMLSTIINEVQGSRQMVANDQQNSYQAPQSSPDFSQNVRNLREQFEPMERLGGFGSQPQRAPVGTSKTSPLRNIHPEDPGVDLRMIPGLNKYYNH